MAPPCRFTDNQLREALSKGLGNKATARLLGCVESVVFRARRRLGIPSTGVPSARKVHVFDCLFLVASGWDVTRLRKRYGADRAAVYRLAETAGICIRRSPVRYPDWSEVDRLLSAGVRVRDVAVITGRNPGTVTQRRRAAGIAKRRRKALLRRTRAERVGAFALVDGVLQPDESPGVAGAGCIASRADLFILDEGEPLAAVRLHDDGETTGRAA